MGVYYGTTEITNVDWIPGDKDITQAFFGGTEVFTVWAEYDGNLPATYGANGSMLADYRIYGASGGVGDDSGTAYGYEVDMSVSDGTTSTTTPIYIGSDPLGEDEYVSFEEQKVYRRTENLFDKDAKDIANGYKGGYYINSVGSTIKHNSWDVTEYIPCIQKTTYYFSNCVGVAASICWYDSNKNFLNGTQINSASGFKNLSLTSPTNASYVRTCVLLEHAGSGSQQYDRNVEVFMITSGSTAPSTYIPYLQPEDPPVPLPQLPTVDGANIVDYTGQSAAVPSRFVAKYRKEGF